MRRATLLLPLVFLTACPSPPTDPDLDKPCNARRAAALAVGTGSDAFQAVGPQGVQIQSGSQGGNHIWIGVSARGLGPNLVLSYGIKENATGTDVTGTLQGVIPLAYDPATDTDVAAGIYGYFSLSSMGQITDASGLVGREVTLWADGADTCHATPIHAEVTAHVSGFAGF